MAEVEDWKATLQRPAQDMRYKTEVRGRTGGMCTCEAHPRPKPVVSTPSAVLGGPSRGRRNAWSGCGSGEPRPAPAQSSLTRRARPSLAQDVTATKGNTFEDYFLKR